MLVLFLVGRGLMSKLGNAAYSRKRDSGSYHKDKRRKAPIQAQEQPKEEPAEARRSP